MILHHHTENSKKIVSFIMFILLRCFLLGYDSSPCKSVNDCKYWRFLLCKSIGVVHQFFPASVWWIRWTIWWPDMARLQQRSLATRTSLLHCTATLSTSHQRPHSTWIMCSRAVNEPLGTFHNHGEGPSLMIFVSAAQFCADFFRVWVS